MDDTYEEQRGYNRGPRQIDENAMMSVRRHFTPYNSFDNCFYNRLLHGNSVRERELMQPHFNSLRKVSLPCDNRHTPADGVCSHFLLHGFNRVNKSAINCGVWSPNAKHLILGTENGNVTLWETETFRFVRPVTVRKSAIREMVFSHLGRCLVTGDHSGDITYFSPSLRLIQVIPGAHANSPVRGLAFSPSDAKFQSSGDDGSVKIWDWETATAEHTYTEHLADVRCSDWHPFRSLVVSGSKDNTVKLWDPRQAESLASIHLHKSSIFTCKFNPVNGNYIATGSKDFNVKIFDIRTMREVECYKGHNREIVTLAWHPVHENILVSGGYNGSMIYWHTDHPGPHTIVMNAHNYSVNLLTFHPLGHLLASGANDGIVKYWCREPPGSRCEIKEFTGSKTTDGAPISDSSSGLVIGHGPFLLDPQATTASAMNTTMNTIYVKDTVASSASQATANAHAGSSGGAGSSAVKAPASGAMDKFIPAPKEPAHSHAHAHVHSASSREGSGRDHHHQQSSSRDTKSYYSADSSRGEHGNSNNKSNSNNKNNSNSNSDGGHYGPGNSAAPRPTPTHFSQQQVPLPPPPPQAPDAQQPAKRSRFS